MVWTSKKSGKYLLEHAGFVGLTYTRRKLQSVLAPLGSGPPTTALVDLRTSFRRRMVKFRRRLVKFRRLQVRYQPEVVSLLAQLPETSMGVDAIQDVPLFLPSSLPRDILINCSKRLVSMETELRIGQCHDSLVQLRTNLTSQARLLKYKYIHVRHQASNTRSRNLLNRINTEIETAATKYRHAFAALGALDPEGTFGWCSELLELRRQDVRGISQPELPNAPTRERAEELQRRSLLNGKVVPEGNRTVSWIWRGSLKGDSGTQGRPKGCDEGLG